MSSLALVPPTPSYTECVVCKKPLGQDSKDAGFRTCQEHRQCAKCGQEMNAREIRLAHDRLLEDLLPGELLIFKTEELLHPRCSITSISITDDPTLSIKQSEYDRLNMIRLMIEPDLELSITTNEMNAQIQSRRLIETMDFDKVYAHLKMMEACVANVSIALAQSRKSLKAKADEREKENFKAAQKQALTSSRPAGKSVEDPEEIQLGTFMELHGLNERKTALKLMRDRNKAVAGLVKVGIPEPMARLSIDAEMVKKGVLPK